jgi:hypothetical protein
LCELRASRTLCLGEVEDPMTALFSVPREWCGQGYGATRGEREGISEPNGSLLEGLDGAVSERIVEPAGCCAE